MRCSPDELTQFEKTSIWLDIVDELNVWLHEIRDNIESTDLELSAVPELRGSAKALRNVINLLPNLAEIARQELEDTHG